MRKTTLAEPILLATISADGGGMIGLLIVLAMTSAPEGLPGVEMYDGRCDYPAELGGRKSNETRVECDVAVVSPSREPNSIMVQFARKSGGALVGFAGDVDNAGTMAVRRIYLTPGAATQATRGHCRIFRNGDAVSGVTCRLHWRASHSSRLQSIRSLAGALTGIASAD